MGKIDKFILSAIVLALVVNVVSNEISAEKYMFQKYLTYILLASLVIWVMWLVTRFVINKLRTGRYAVEAFILNEKKELLIYFHRYHKMHLPPGGRVGINEFPDEAIKKRLEERIGLRSTDYKYCDIFHRKLETTSEYVGNVQRMPIPFVIQKELRIQRGFKEFHYDFIYVLELTRPNIEFPNNKYSPIKFVNLEVIKEMQASKDTFPDVVNIYEGILDFMSK